MASTAERRQLFNASTRVYVLILGTLIGLTGIAHGVFEFLQGDRPTGGWLLSGVGAVTIIGNYRLTGIAAAAVGVAVVAWVLVGVHKSGGPLVFLALSLVLVLVGGGIAIVPALLLAFAVATRIHAPLSWWTRALPEAIRRVLADSWLPSLLGGLSLFLAGVAFWLVVLPPGAEQRAVGPLHYLLWSLLLAGLLLLVFALVSGFARDIELAAAATAAQHADQADAALGR